MSWKLLTRFVTEPEGMTNLFFKLKFIRKDLGL